MKNRFKKFETTFYLIVILLFPLAIFAQDKIGTQFKRDTLINAAKQMMETSRYCALITLDEKGHPDTRIMDPFLPDDKMVVWFGTNSNSRKVKQIQNDSRVTLYYQAPNQVGYIQIKGQAYIVDDSLKKQIYWKNDWSRFYSEDKSEYTLIKVIPDKLEIIDYQHGIFGDSKTLDVPFVKFQPGKSN